MKGELSELAFFCGGDA